MTSETSQAQEYTLLYHPGIPGRGEFIRLALEATRTKYTDAGNESEEGAKQVCSLVEDDDEATDSKLKDILTNNPPPFAPPMLKVTNGGKNNKSDLLISQTSNILLYLGRRLNLSGEDEVDSYHINALTLTALDLNNEAHDTHHPVAVGDYYEDQRDEAKRRSTDFRANRVPKFFGYFERVLRFNSEVQGGGGKEGGMFLVGKRLSYADLTLWQVLDGLKFAFPNEVKHQESKYPLLLGTFYPGIQALDGIKEYLSSDRRLKYSMGIFRHYPELDRQG